MCKGFLHVANEKHYCVIYCFVLFFSTGVIALLSGAESSSFSFQVSTPVNGGQRVHFKRWYALVQVHRSLVIEMIGGTMFLMRNKKVEKSLQ